MIRLENDDWTEQGIEARFQLAFDRPAGLLRFMVLMSFGKPFGSPHTYDFGGLLERVWINVRREDQTMHLETIATRRTRSRMNVAAGGLICKALMYPHLTSCERFLALPSTLYIAIMLRTPCSGCTWCLLVPIQ